MAKTTPWDFRDEDELVMSAKYENDGYVIHDANHKYLERMKQRLKDSFHDFAHNIDQQIVELENAHKIIDNEQSNNLRLHIMQELSKDTEFNRNYYYSAKKLIHTLCGNELAMQKRPGISINLPNNQNDVLPIHADTWNGVSPFELNIWIPFVDCYSSMSLYILKRKAYTEKLRECSGLLKLTSDELYNELRECLTWIPIEYGKVLVFDQSLPHGYSLNKEKHTHWSMNCRFKGLHTPYWDKKLGEYFMPINVKSSTRLGLEYKHPENWI